MCKWNKYGDTRIDPCMRKLVDFINWETRFKTIMCCCGHNKCNPSLIVIDPNADGSDTDVFDKPFDRPFDIFSNIRFKHKQKRFYKKDKKGVYFIPEVKDLLK